MYDELINKLRIGAKCFPGYELYGYAKEPFRLIPEHLTQAADAIEELQLYESLYKDLTEKSQKVATELKQQLQKSEADNVNLTGWLAEEHAKRQWIPVTERLPDVWKHVITFDEDDGVRVNWRCGDNVSWSIGYHVTHWMPLPEPPEEDIPMEYFESGGGK